jgi:hypothetical protein
MVLSKHKITSIALEYLAWTGFECWRQPNNTAKRWKNNVTHGIPDIIGYERNSQVCKFMGCEVKALGDILSQAQKDRLTDIVLRGGHAFIACQIGNNAEVIPYTEYIKPKNRKT